MAEQIILHQYWQSPFTEKVRLVLGMKQLSWRAVEQPSIMPKPELLPLTGGYRRIPVMQIGADIYCDSQMILNELERRHPGAEGAAGGLHAAIGAWADQVVFNASVVLIFSELAGAGAVDEAFKKDREALSGRPFDPEAMKAAVPAMRQQWRAFCSFVEAQLASHGEFLHGGVSSSDVHAYMNVWFVSRFVPDTAEALLAEFPRLRQWMTRMEAIGYGSHSDMSRSDAMAVARESAPATAEDSDPNDPDGLEPGVDVTVAATDYGRDPVEGVLVASSPQHVAIRRTAAEVGEVVVHFPRAGFTVTPA
ncbi:MAG: glutathione S-transferase family protein [Pseudomonadota bacterium]